MALEIPDTYKVYSPSEGISENYLLDDIGPSENRILIFGRTRSLEILHYSKVWYCDGAFNVAPAIFARLRYSGGSTKWCPSINLCTVTE